MFLFLLIPLLIAWARGYRVGGIFRVIDCYPLFALVAVHLVFILFAFCGDYRFVPWADWLQMLMILSLLLPILRRKLFGKALLGTFMVLGGSGLNRLVMHQNGGKMPVYPTLSEAIGYVSKSDLAGSVDSVHILMTSSTHLNFLGDYIDFGLYIMSIGDVLIHAFASLVLYGTVAAVCGQRERA